MVKIIFLLYIHFSTGTEKWKWLTSPCDTAFDSPKLDKQLVLLLTENASSKSWNSSWFNHKKGTNSVCKNHYKVEIFFFFCNWIAFVSDFLFNFHKKRNHLMLIPWRGRERWQHPVLVNCLLVRKSHAHGILKSKRKPHCKIVLDERTIVFPFIFPLFVLSRT